MLLSFEDTLKKVCELLEKNKGIILSVEVFTDIVLSTRYNARFRTDKFIFVDYGVEEAFMTDSESMEKANYPEDYDHECGADKVVDPVQKIYLRIAYDVYQHYLEALDEYNTNGRVVYMRQ